MRKASVFAVAVTLLLAVSLFGAASAQSSLVGVKAGDWIQYHVTETGNVPSEYNITWARMDVTNVQGMSITVNVQTRYGNGTLYPENNIVFNLATGAIGDGFFVPLNVTVGDRYSTEFEGIINLTSTQHIEAAGAQRSVLVGVTSVSTYDFDKQTGIMISATSNLGTCTMITKASATNLWAPQTLGLNQTAFYALVVAGVAAVVVIVVAALAFFLERKRGVVKQANSFTFDIWQVNICQTL